MTQPQTDKLMERAKIIALKVADRIPLPLHYILNGVFMMLLLGDLVVPDALPFLDEILGTAGLYYYNAYLLRRTFGVINPMRIIRGESPAAKRRMGLLPYEQQMEKIKDRLKAMRKAAKSTEIPGLDKTRVDKLTDEIKQIEKRLRLLDRLLSKSEFQDASVKMEIARIEAQAEAIDDPEIRQESVKAVEHARNHLNNIDRLKEERNRLVARLDRFNLQLNDTYSRLMAFSVPLSEDPETSRLFDELFTSISNFDETLKELEAKPSADLYQAAVREIEETEEKFGARKPQKQPDKV